MSDPRFNIDDLITSAIADQEYQSLSIFLAGYVTGCSVRGAHIDAAKAIEYALRQMIEQWGA
jgi:DNA-binding PucR family transcriptional regulator